MIFFLFCKDFFQYIRDDVPGLHLVRRPLSQYDFNDQPDRSTERCQNCTGADSSLASATIEQALK